ncbi:tubulin folding cofactor D C terminal-domain-containing protein [Geopyxis carbonaria]|nr:tubulin folding cofactor D C terminal-domain-containing protein [Geopyxis carbonaria]
MADAPDSDRDVQLLQAGPSLFSPILAELPALFAAAPATVPRARVDALIALLEPFQESPQLLDPHLPALLGPLTSAFVVWLKRGGDGDATDATPHPTSHPGSTFTLPTALSKLLYTLAKIRGPKLIARFLPPDPLLLERVAAVPLDDAPWELRYVVLLWLGHLLLAPFDLSTISDENIPAQEEAIPGTAHLPSLARRLLALAVRYLGSPGNRESDAAAGCLVRIAQRRDMKEAGLLDAVVAWGVAKVAEQGGVADGRGLFLKTGVLLVLAGMLAENGPHVEKIFLLVKGLQDDGADEWGSAGVRRLGMKVYRWVAKYRGADEDVVADIVERLLTALGDRDTAVRFGASKSLAVVARRLDADMAGDVVEAVMAVYDEDVFPDPVSGARILATVDAEKWHGATLTLATFLRQRAIRTTDVLARVCACIVDALSFEQRRATFALGSNVRDAACYAAWSLARSYTTAELLAAGELVVPATGFAHGRSMPQIIATELVVAGCLDPMGNVRRAASAALQELVGRHPGCVTAGIALVQAVDYATVALRRRSVVTVAAAAGALDTEYWTALTHGIITGWRGVGAADDDGRKLAASSLGALTALRPDGGATFDALLARIRGEGGKHTEIYHGGLFALAAHLDALPPDALTPAMQHALTHDVFAKLRGHEFINPILHPELTAAATSRLVESLCRLPLRPSPATLRLWTALLLAALQHDTPAFTTHALAALSHLFPLLSPANCTRLIEHWTAPPARVGAILALGAVRASPQTILAAAAHPAITIRVAALQALPALPPSAEITAAITAALDDYTTDPLRGDIGSWARAAAIAALPDGVRPPALARVACEKLDRLRGLAAAALGVSEEGWSHLPQLLDAPEYRAAAVRGLVTSAGAAPEGLMRASRRALIAHISASPAAAAAVATELLATLQEGTERTTVPTLEVVALLLDLALLPLKAEERGRLFHATQRAHFKSANVGKLVVAVGVYRSLALSEGTAAGLRREVVKKLVAMLTHPFPRVRVEVSEALWIVVAQGGDGEEEGRQSEEEAVGWGEAVEMLGAQEWSGGVKTLAGAVRGVRGVLVGA